MVCVGSAKAAPCLGIEDGDGGIAAFGGHVEEDFGFKDARFERFAEVFAHRVVGEMRKDWAIL